MASLDRRIAVIERQRPTLGWRTFYTADRATFWEARDYRQAIPDPDGNPPEGVPTFTRDQVDELGRAGWSVFLVEWAEWREVTA